MSQTTELLDELRKSFPDVDLRQSEVPEDPRDRWIYQRGQLDMLRLIQTFISERTGIDFRPADDSDIQGDGTIPVDVLLRNRL